jgi:hypothetical protein
MKLLRSDGGSRGIAIGKANSTCAFVGNILKIFLSRTTKPEKNVFIRKLLIGTLFRFKFFTIG